MGYTKQTWVSGDTITAEKLNYLENGIKDNELGYGYEDIVTLLCEGEGTAEAAFGHFAVTLFYSGETIFDSVKVTIDGIEHILPYSGTNVNMVMYGEGSLSNVPPFVSIFSDAINVIGVVVDEAGTYNIKVEGIKNAFITSKEFDEARGYWKESIKYVDNINLSNEDAR